MKLQANKLLLALLALEPSSAVYNFVSWGDWGTGSSLQKQNAARLNEFCAQDDACSIALTLGDNYYNGPNSTWDKRWKTEFMDMYTFDSPFYNCMGNHDYSGKLQAQLEFKNDTRWNLPATNYTISIPEADMTIVMVDTPRACPSYMSKPYGDCTEECMLQLAEVGCTNTTSVECWLGHVAWLNATLAGITTTWKLVAGHHPIDQEHMPLMAPALAAHGVQAYLAGHVHNMQHAVGKDGVQYFVSGAGAFASLDADVTAATSQEDHDTKPHGHGDGNDYLPGDVKVGTSHRPRGISCPEGAVCHPLTSSFVADGPGFLALSVDNDASPPTTTARFYHANGTMLYETSFTA